MVFDVTHGSRDAQAVVQTGNILYRTDRQHRLQFGDYALARIPSPGTTNDVHCGVRK